MNVGLVLSGGMAKGAYEVGALSAVSEFFTPNDIGYISAASIGTLNAFAFACGRQDYGFQMWRDITKENDRIFLKAALEGEYLKETIRNLTSHRPVCEKFYFPLFHVKSRSVLYFDFMSLEDEMLEQALSAAIAVFPICKPVPLDGKYYYDGAVIDNIPVYPMLKLPLDLIICIYFDEFDYMFESSSFDSKIIKITFIDDSDSLRSSVLITRDNTERMFGEGYKKTKAALEFVFQKGMDNLEEIYSRIEMLNSFQSKKKKRLTGDVAMDNINKIAQKIVKVKET